MKRKSFYSTGAIAKICDVAPRTVGKWFDCGILKGYRIPAPDGELTDRRVPRANLVKFMRDYGIPLGALEGDLAYYVLQVANTVTPMVFETDRVVLSEAAIQKTDLRYCAEIIYPKIKDNLAGNIFQAGLVLGSTVPTDLVVVDLSIGVGEAVDAINACQQLASPPKFVGLGYEDLTCGQISSLKAHGFLEVFVRPFDPDKVVEYVHLQATINYNETRSIKAKSQKAVSPSRGNNEVEQSVR